MKINFILPGLGQSGGISVVEKYKELMQRDGHDVVIYSAIKNSNLYRYNSSLLNIMHQIYCTLKTFGTFITRKKKNYQWVWKINDNGLREADATIATMWISAFEVNKLSEKCGRKFYFIQGYEVWDNEELAKKSYMLPLNKIVISTWINNKLKQELNIGPFPIVMNGLDNSICFQYKKENKEVSEQKINILMLNHIMPEKGVINGIKAVERVKRKYKGCCLRMFGMCNADNLPNWIEYHRNPSKRELSSLYSSSDIFIFPSLEEGWGLTPLEAMSFGCAVVGTNTGFVLDIGVNRENMMISPPGDIDKMVCNLIELVENISLRERLQLNGYKTVKKLDWNVSAKKFLALLYEDEDICI